MAMPPPPEHTVSAAPQIATPSRNPRMLAAGSVLRIIGAILGGFAIMILGVMLLAPLSFVGPNPFGFFATFGVALILGGISVMLTGVGWSLQTWGRG